MINEILTGLAVLFILSAIAGIVTKQIGGKLFFLTLNTIGLLMLTFVQGAIGRTGVVMQGIFLLPALLGFVVLVYAVCRTNHIETADQLTGVRQGMPYIFAAAVVFAVVLTGIPGTGSYVGYFFSVAGRLAAEGNVLSWIGLAGVALGFVNACLITFSILKPAYLPGEKKKGLPVWAGAIFLLIAVALIGGSLFHTQIFALSELKGENNYGLLILWLFPVLGGMIAFALGKKSHSTRNDWMDIMMFVEAVMLVCMGYELVKNWSNLSLDFNSFFVMGLHMSMDSVKLLLCAVFVFLFGVVSCFMKESLKQENGSNRYMLLYMGLFGVALGALLTEDFFGFTMFTGFSMLMVYPLMIHRNTANELKYTGHYILFSMLAIFLTMGGFLIALVYVGATKYVNFYSSVILNGYNKLEFAGGILLFLGFAICAGLFPLHFPVAKANSYCLMETSAVYTCGVSKLGVLGVLLLGANFLNGSGLYGKTLLAMGIATAVWGIFVTMTSTDIRRILMGLNMAANGMITLSAGLMVVGGDTNAYAVKSSLYLLAVSSVSLAVLYMTALELVREKNTYEIKGLIASGKPHKLLTVAGFVACASLIGVPGTAGFLGYSMLYQFILKIAGWKWLMVLFLILWAFFATAVVRVFMKFFVSKKDKTIKILSEEELSVEAETDGGEEKPQEKTPQEKTPAPYRTGEILLLVFGLLQVAIGLFPAFTVEKLSGAVNLYFKGRELTGAVSYYTKEMWIVFAIVAVLCLILYVNLVHGVLLRAVRNKKNRKLQEEKAGQRKEEQEESELENR